MLSQAMLLAVLLLQALLYLIPAELLQDISLLVITPREVVVSQELVFLLLLRFSQGFPWQAQFLQLEVSLLEPQDPVLVSEHLWQPGTLMPMSDYPNWTFLNLMEIIQDGRLFRINSIP